MNRIAKPLLVFFALAALALAGKLDTGFATPPKQARIRCYWWWLNGNVTRQSITRDLEQMKAKGFGGALLIDAGGAEQRRNRQVPAGPLFGSPEWRALFRHAVVEADRLGLDLALNILSGWNLGGPMVKPEDSAKLVTWSQTAVKGPARIDQVLEQPKSKEGFYRDIAVLAYPLRHGAAPNKRPIQGLPFKASFKEVGASVPDTTPLLRDLPAEPGEEDTYTNQVRNISAQMDAGGRLRWDVPEGEWEILRFGYTSSGSRVSTSSGAWQGLVIDYMDRNALEKYWKQVVDPILADVRPYFGKSLTHLVTDSWELNGVNWTPRFAGEFRKRRKYDMLPFAPVFAGRIVDSRETTLRFLNDLRRAIGDLVADEHYSAFAAMSANYGLRIHPESGGPHGAPLDALKCLGRSDFPQMEYWSKSPMHRVKDSDRFFVKQASSAAHIYGKTLVAAEGFTNIGMHWNESLWSNLKPTFDRALCEGLNLHIWHTFTSSPAEMGIPGQEYFAGTHFNPNVTWWPQAGAFVAYLNRSSFLMQQGKFVADALYYYGDHVPNFVQLKTSDPARVMPGFDYDVTNEEVLLTRLAVRNGRLTLPDGMRYRVLVLPSLGAMSIEALRKVRDLVNEGATVIGHTRPTRITGLENAAAADKETAAIVQQLWGACDGTTVKQNKLGKGRLVCAGTARELLIADGVKPDFEARGAVIDYIHRGDVEGEIYFVSNQSEQAVDFHAVFRTSGMAPEIWDAVSGQKRIAAEFDFTTDRRTRVNMHLDPYGSAFVIFRSPAPRPRKATPEKELARNEVAGPWMVSFESPAAKPSPREFAALKSWTAFDEPALKYFSGTATYAKDIELTTAMTGPGKRVVLDLGQVGELVETRVNGVDLGVHWTFPFAIDITRAARPGKNRVEIRVTNFWVNRLVGDAKLPEAERTTRTNITQFNSDTQLLPAGLMGPVTLRVTSVAARK